MKVFLTMFFVTSGCKVTSYQAQDDIHHRGGSDPVICYMPRKFLQACRDGKGTLWICDIASPVECMQADEPASIFSIKAATPENSLRLRRDS